MATKIDLFAFKWGSTYMSLGSRCPLFESFSSRPIPVNLSFLKHQCCLLSVPPVVGKDWCCLSIAGTRAVRTQPGFFLCLAYLVNIPCSISCEVESSSIPRPRASSPYIVEHPESVSLSNIPSVVLMYGNYQYGTRRVNSWLPSTDLKRKSAWLCTLTVRKRVAN